jgi:signal transduction histidine kinase
VAESHGGTVTVESKVGKGTTFLVTLPVTGPSMTTGT